MGIANLNVFLRKHCPDVFETIHISEYAFKRVAIDTSLFLCKFKAICGDRWLSAFVNLVSCLRRNEIHCVFIYDTGCVVEKEEERAERRRQQEKNKQRVIELDTAYEKYELEGEIDPILIDLYNKTKDKPVQISRNFLSRPSKVSSTSGKDPGINMNIVKERIEKMRSNILDISKEDFELTKKLFKILNIPFYDAPLEAETMCSDLCKRGLVDGVLSEDTDVLAYASPIFLTKIDTTLDTCVRICYEDVLRELDISKEQFIDMCIMFGCDYNKNIPKVGIETSFKYIQKYGSLEEIEKHTKHDTSILNYKRTRELFTGYPQHEINNIPYCGAPDFEELQRFVTENNLNISLENLRKSFLHNTVVIIENNEDEDEDKEI